MKQFINTHTKELVYVAWIISIIAALGSLFLSEVLSLAPCELCWFQRIFMYPLPFVIGALIARDNYTEAPYYVLPLSLIGGGIALYHYYLQMFAHAGASSCSSIVACTTKYYEFFGFITIPFGSLVGFTVITAIMVAVLRYKD